MTNRQIIYLLIFTSNLFNMLQRIQSIWLLLASICIFALFLFPYLQVLNADGSAKSIKVTGVHENVAGQVVQTEAFLGLTIATVVLAMIPLFTIFLYRNRSRQLSAGYATIVLTIGFSFWLVQTAKSVLGNITLRTENYGIGVLLPSLAVFFLILAIRGIKRDERLIRSADRLR